MGDPNRFPEDIESLVDQRELFKIHLKKRAEESFYRGTLSLGVSGSSGTECDNSTARKGKGVVVQVKDVGPIEVIDSPLPSTQRDVVLEQTTKLRGT
ncbi:unnamed protein product [Cuscuta epithymum]|uniref:Uncharacterized protein n=1 Tax=Cuscuta epithymum TaxID=186058 RepID=A0AAV0EJS1_9ASTE|nr:unnamed protein product [Cuscuta epithymum]